MYITPMSRGDLLSILPNKGRVAELGVNNGGFAAFINRRNNPSELHLIDPWGGDEDEYVALYGVKDSMEEKYQKVLAMFAKDIGAGRVHVHRAYSADILDRFEDGFFSWIYIDAMHTYERVLEDLNNWHSKVARDGFLVGHDFSNTMMSRAKKFGIIRAVREFLADHPESKLIAVTNEAAPTWVMARDPQSERARKFENDLLLANPAVVEVDLDMIDYFDQVEVRPSEEKRLQVFRFSRTPDTSIRRKL